MYKCKVVSISCILLSLFYYYFIDIIIFYSIWFLFRWLFRVFFLSHCCVTLCSVFFLVVLCIYSCYHLYSVLPYNLCCSLKGFLKMEKKKNNNNKACPEVIMYCYTSCEYAKWLQLFLIVKRFKMRGKKIKKKKVLNLCTSLSNLCGRGFTGRRCRLWTGVDPVMQPTTNKIRQKSKGSWKCLQNKKFDISETEMKKQKCRNKINNNFF